MFERALSVSMCGHCRPGNWRVWHATPRIRRDGKWRLGRYPALRCFNLAFSPLHRKPVETGRRERETSARSRAWLAGFWLKAGRRKRQAATDAHQYRGHSRRTFSV